MGSILELYCRGNRHFAPIYIHFYDFLFELSLLLYFIDRIIYKDQRNMEVFASEEVHESKVMPSKLLVQHSPPWGKENFYSSEIGEESSESEDEGIFPSTV
ncbi:hypothetical protein AVEN_40259-1, partial [Araneus ventricosus]